MMERRAKGRGGWVAVALLLVPAVYALSVGPFGWLEARGLVPGGVEPVMWGFYAPHRWLCQHWAAYAGFFVRYMDFWI